MSKINGKGDSWNLASWPMTVLPSQLTAAAESQWKGVTVGVLALSWSGIDGQVLGHGLEVLAHGLVLRVDWPLQRRLVPEEGRVRGGVRRLQRDHVLRMVRAPGEGPTRPG